MASTKGGDHINLIDIWRHVVFGFPLFLRPLGNLSRPLYFRELLAKTNKSHVFFGRKKKKETRRRPPVKTQRLVSDQTYNWTEVMEESRKHSESNKTEQNQKQTLHVLWMHQNYDVKTTWQFETQAKRWKKPKSHKVPKSHEYNSCTEISTRFTSCQQTGPDVPLVFQPLPPPVEDGNHVTLMWKVTQGRNRRRRSNAIHTQRRRTSEPTCQKSTWTLRNGCG